MKPTISDVHLATNLSDLAVGFFETDQNLAWPAVFPPLNVQKRTDSYPIWSQSDLMRIEAKVRGPGTRAPMKGAGITSGTYTCNQYATSWPIADEVAQNQDASIDTERAGTFIITDDVARAVEVVWAANYFTTSVWTDLVAGTDFLAFDSAGADPVLYVHQQRVNIRRKTRKTPNVFAVGADVDVWLKNNPDIKDRIKYTMGASVITDDLLAQMFGVKKYVVVGGSQNTAIEGATAVYADIGGKHALLVYAAEAPSTQAPSGGYTFLQTADQPGGTEFPGVRIYDYYVPQEHQRYLEAQIDVDPKMVSSVCGVFFPNVVS